MMVMVMAMSDEVWIGVVCHLLELEVNPSQVEGLRHVRGGVEGRDLRERSRVERDRVRERTRCETVDVIETVLTRCKTVDVIETVLWVWTSASSATINLKAGTWMDPAKAAVAEMYKQQRGA